MMRQTFAELEFVDESDRKKKYVMAESDNRIVLCGASAYEQKYYFNPIFEKIPKSIQDELRIICTLFTEEVGGVITLVFEEDGALSIDTEYAEDDFYYDEISSGLMVRKIKSTREELLESLVLYYRVFVKHEDINQLLAQEEE
jgi:hypothetical protein